VHPLRVSKGFEMAAQVAIDNISSISETVEFTKEDPRNLIQTVMTSLGSKIVNNYQVSSFIIIIISFTFLMMFQEQMATLAVNAVLAVADFERRDVNLDLIKMQGNYSIDQ
jgi:T-complex protein 1 subunit epsilon